VRGNKGSSSVPEFQIIECDSRIFKNEGQKISDKRRRTNKPKIKHNNWSRTHPFLSPIHEINNEETERNSTDSTYRCVRAALARIPLDRLRIVDLILGCACIETKTPINLSDDWFTNEEKRW
jgi:hypothetical protein